MPKRPNIILLCKQGNDSQVAAAAIRRSLRAQAESSVEDEEGETQVRDVIGGLRAWSKQIDPSFPLY